MNALIFVLATFYIHNWNLYVCTFGSSLRNVITQFLVKMQYLNFDLPPGKEKMRIGKTGTRSQDT